MYGMRVSQTDGLLTDTEYAQIFGPTVADLLKFDETKAPKLRVPPTLIGWWIPSVCRSTILCVAEAWSYCHTDAGGHFGVSQADTC